MPRPTCDTCKAYYPLTKECRRHAPVMVPVPQHSATGQVVGMQAAGCFPATDPQRGCCEHLPDDTLQLQ